MLLESYQNNGVEGDSFDFYWLIVLTFTVLDFYCFDFYCFDFYCLQIRANTQHVAEPKNISANKGTYENEKLFLVRRMGLFTKGPSIKK